MLVRGRFLFLRSGQLESDVVDFVVVNTVEVRNLGQNGCKIQNQSDDPISV